MTSRRLTPGRALSYLALAGYVVLLGFPLVWLLSTSFKTPRELASLSPSLLPEEFSLTNFRAAIEQQDLLRAGANSLIVAGCTTVLVVLVSVPASYALARFRSRLRGVAMGWILVSQVFPIILIVVPLFLILKQFGLIDSLAGLVLVDLVWSLPFALWMLQGYVAKIPAELEEAAATDGASRLRTLTRIVFPLLLPGIAATSMFAFVLSWNEFFFALVLIQDPQLNTLPLALARFVGQEGQVQLGPLAAGSLLSMIPSLVFFALMQRRLTSGLLAGAVKG
ncbi:carbohydrate ABC transporter permease [Actinocatenispora sera]|uniref:Sugar ABC transporter permease n=1 Tax=Actinocatenispora sera TaxID=390989 RepID=A0A810L6W5_9ACTN|nr:carbohydrate ABC transporter permease [Actinocatenispora sera]BCJ30096.1 sugar ABC transporter permease [Actinocatenispora sera]